MLSDELDRSNSPSTREMVSLVVKNSLTHQAEVIAQLVATRVAAHRNCVSPTFDPFVDPKFMAMIHGYLPA